MSETATQTPPEHRNHLPQGVRAAAERANERLREIGVLPPKEGEGQGQEGQPAEGQEPHQGQGQEAPPAPPPGQEPPAQGQEPPKPPAEGDLEHKYKSLKGRYDASERELANLRGQMEGMRELLANLQAPQDKAPPKTEESFTAPPDSRLTEQDRHDYGEDLLGVMRKVATEVAYEIAGRVRDEIKEVRQSVGNVATSVQKTEQEKFLDGLTAAVPDWQALNTAEDFLAWLGETDPLSGQRRQELLNEAVQARHAPRVAAFFNSFKREQAAVNPAAAQPPPTQAPARGSVPATGKLPLEQLAAPGRGSAGGATSPQDKPVYTHADIARFYDDRRRGRFRGREAEAAATERDIIAAQREGRIRQP